MGLGCSARQHRLSPFGAERVAKLALYSRELNCPIWVILTSTRSRLQLQLSGERLPPQLFLIYGFKSVCDERPENDLVVEVVVALVHLLQPEAPLVLHVDVGVELPLCSLHQLTGTRKIPV